MYVGVYFLVASLSYLIGRFVLRHTERYRPAYAGRAIAVALGVLALFQASSAMLAFGRVGGATSLRYPDDYLIRGPLGWLAMLLPIAGMVSPLVIAVWLTLRRDDLGIEERPL